MVLTAIIRLMAFSRESVCGLCSVTWSPVFPNPVPYNAVLPNLIWREPFSRCYNRGYWNRFGYRFFCFYRGVGVLGGKNGVFLPAFVSGLVEFLLRRIGILPAEAEQVINPTWLSGYIFFGTDYCPPDIFLLEVFEGSESKLNTVIVFLYLVMTSASVIIGRPALMVLSLVDVLYGLSALLRMCGMVNYNLAIAGILVTSALLMLSGFWHIMRECFVGTLPAKLKPGLRRFNKRLTRVVSREHSNSGLQLWTKIRTPHVQNSTTID